MKPALLSHPDVLVGRALAYWHGAEEDVRRAGRSWYPVIADRACSLAPHLPRETVLGAMAILSPRISVAQNLYDLETVLTGRPFTTSAFPRNVERARRLIDGEPFDSLVGRAPKTRAFLANLLGDETAVTVDTWMVTILLDRPRGEREDTALTYRQYEILADILARGAERVGVSPRTFQATTWIAARRAAF